MLVLHPSSRCDVCLSEYSWEIPGLRPHAISCGHIFCMNCLIANRPPLCPLCRKEYQPNKMKKLHVDRPDELDDHKELDLLQRLAISWEVPEDQLDELTAEVDSWLRDRSDDSCIALRKARAALDRQRQLRELTNSLNETVRKTEERAEEQHRTLQLDVDRVFAAYKASSDMIDKLAKEVYYLSFTSNFEVRSHLFVRQNNALKMHNQALQSNTQRYTHTHNPLPRPPEPIPTNQVPTLEQAVSQSGTVRFAPLPVSPRSTVGTPYPFEIERRSHRRGKSKPDERGYYDDSSRYNTPISSPLPPAETPHSHHSRHRVTSPASHHSYDHYSSPKQATRATGLQVHFDNTAQPLDAFSLTHAYLKEYSSGFINGQEAALGQRMSEFPPSNQTPLAGQSRQRTQPASASVEPSQAYRPTIASSVYPSQPYSAPITHERSPRPAHRRQATVTSIISTSTSSIHNDRPSSSSRSRSRPSDMSSPVGSPPYSNPLLASIFSDTQSPRGQSITPISPQPIYAIPPAILSPPLSSQQPPLSQPQQPALSRNSSVISNSLPPTASNPRNSPSSRSHMTLQSSDTWGTATPSHLASGSLIDGLRAFRLGAAPVMEGGQPPVSFHELGSDGASVRTREMSFSDVSSEHGNGNGSNNVNVPPSPVRAIHSMVGVLPVEGDGGSSSPYRSRRDDRDRASSYRSPTSFDIHSHHQNGYINAGHRNSQYSTSNSVASRGRNEEESRSAQRVASSNHNHWNGSYPHESSYRSPLSSSTPQRGYEDRTSRDGYQRAQSHTSSRAYGVDDRDRRQQLRYVDDNTSITSSITSSRHSSRRPPPPHTRTSHLSLPAESPFPVSVEYSESTEESHLRAPSRDTDGSGSGSNSSTIRGVPVDFGNALGLQLSTSDLDDDDETPISAPTPVASNSSRTFLRSWSREHYES